MSPTIDSGLHAWPCSGEPRCPCADIADDVKPVVRKYLGTEVGDAYVDGTRPNGTNEVVVRIRPERWYSRDFGRQQ